MKKQDFEKLMDNIVLIEVTETDTDYNDLGECLYLYNIDDWKVLDTEEFSVNINIKGEVNRETDKKDYNLEICDVFSFDKKVKLTASQHNVLASELINNIYFL